MKVPGRVALSGGGVAALVLLAGFALLPLAQQPFVTRIGTGIFILALATISLNLLVGYGGLVSFGHAAYFGAGAYAVAILSHYGTHRGWIAFAAAVGGSALLALILGAASLRVRGVFFIMITLAFAQMLYHLSTAVEKLGGDDGLRVVPNSFGPLFLGERITLYYVSLGLLCAGLVISDRLVASHFGRVLVGIRDNERRMRSLGYNPYHYRLLAFVIAGALAGLAGALEANLDAYASPELLHWSISGDLLVMLVLGGSGSIVGPLFGAVSFQLVQQVLSGFTSHWMLYFGPALVLIVFVSRRGVAGLFAGTRPHHVRGER